MPLPREATLGEFAYPPYRPAQAGVIVEIVLPPPDAKTGLGHVCIETPTGKRLVTSVYERFDDLLESHRRKLRTHEATRLKLRALKETRGYA